jgi:hypothetical protein
VSALGGPPDGAGEDREPELPQVDVQIPDDARELDADLRSYLLEERQRLREQRARSRRGLWSRVLWTRRWQRFGLSGPLLTLCLLVVAGLGSLMAVFGPRPSPFPQPQPLAIRTALASGSVGGLLPDVQVVGRNGARAARDLRPAVLALVPGACECVGRVDSAFRQAREYLVRFTLVAGPSARTEVRRLALEAGNGTIGVLHDPAGALERAYEADGLTLIFVRADGIVADVVRDLPEGARIEAIIAPIAQHASRQPRR